MTKEKTVKILKVILIIILAVILAILIKKIINKEEIPIITNTKAYIVLSGSMEPDINIGDIVIVKQANKEEINVGDVISFSKGNSIITHRVVEILDTEGVAQYKTKGDNNNTEDIGMIKYENINGKLSNTIPKLGYLVIFIQQNILVIVLVFIFLIVFIKTKPNREKDAKRSKK